MMVMVMMMLMTMINDNDGGDDGGDDDDGGGGCGSGSGGGGWVAAVVVVGVRRTYTMSRQCPKGKNLRITDLATVSVSKFHQISWSCRKAELWNRLWISADFGNSLFISVRCLRWGVGQSFLTSRFARNEIDFFSPLNSKVTQLVNCTWKLPEPLKVGVPGGDGIKCEFLLWLWTKSQDAFRDIQKDVTRCHLPIRNLVFVQVNASGESIGAGPTRNKVKATGLRNA